MPQTAMPQNFEVSEAVSGDTIQVTDVIYKPDEKQVVLTVKPDILFGLDCNAKLKSGLMYTDGVNRDETIITGKIEPEYSYLPYSIGVNKLTLYNEESEILYPKAYEPFVAKVELINQSRTAQTKRLLLYLNDDIDKPLADAEVSVGAQDTKNYAFSFPNGIDWQETDILNVSII